MDGGAVEVRVQNWVMGLLRPVPEGSEEETGSPANTPSGSASKSGEKKDNLVEERGEGLIERKGIADGVGERAAGG
eukprot:4270016-Prorocentrum_lima.AAC.1